MSEEVKMPQMGESIAEGTIVKWLKKVGDAVKRDEPLFEISTDKVDAEIPSPTAGVLSEIKVQEGETVAVNTVVAVINGGGGAAKPAAEPAKEAPPAPKQEPSRQVTQTQPEPAPPAPKAPEPARPAPAAPAPRESVEAPAGEPASAEELRRTRSSPVVRKIAEEHGVDISQIEGTGISGRVTKQDILSFVENRGAGAKVEPAAAPSVAPITPPASPAGAAPAPPRAPQPQRAPAATQAEAGPQPFAEGDRIEIEPMSIMRRRIAERMVESRHVSAHVTSFM